MSHNKQSHQHQPHNPPSAAMSVQAPSTPAPAEIKGDTCTKGTGKCTCPKCQSHIRARAYEISQARNGGPGDATSDWSQAEIELTAASAMKA